MRAEARLTPRETEVAELLAWGAAKKEVADRLYISQRTVENTTRNIFAKIGIQKATELCVWWFCTKHGVSFELSPIKRAIVASVILFAFVQSDVLGPNDAFRFFRSRSSRTAEVRLGYRGSRRAEEDFTGLFDA